MDSGDRIAALENTQEVSDMIRNPGGEANLLSREVFLQAKFADVAFIAGKSQRLSVAGCHAAVREKGKSRSSMKRLHDT